MYIDHFKLNDEPFSLTPDPAYLYLSPEHREALAAIQYGLLAGRGFCTLIGEVGTGKTTLLYGLLSQVGPDMETAYIAYTAQSFEDLLASVLRDLRVEPGGATKGTMLAALNAHLQRRADEGRTVAIVIDEAQGLSDEAFEELRLLSNFESYTRKLLQIVLVGQPELQLRLRQPHLRQLRERVGVRAVINPLSSTEMERYIDHRLRCAGGTVAALFEPWAVSAIVRRSAGIPRRANILCHNALLFAYGRGLGKVTARVAREAVAEMDERQPIRIRQRAALRMVGSALPGRRWVAIGAGVALGIAALSHLVTAGSRVEPGAGPAPAGQAEVVAEVPSAPPPPAGVKEEAVAEAAAEPTVVAAEPAAAPAAERVDSSPPAPAVEPAPPPPAAAPGTGPFALTVPQGANLTQIVRQLYGPNVSGETARGVFDEVRRLNPQIRDVNMIMAGELLRLPAPPHAGGADIR